MEPVFTLQWSEFSAARRIADKFKKSEGYSTLIPLSREESGIDFVLMKKLKNQQSKSITFQVKSSRTYATMTPKRSTTQRLKYHTWYNRFDVSELADFYLLTGHFIQVPTNGAVAGKLENWYRDCTLLFQNDEMQNLIQNLKTVKGKPDRQFGFGFDDLSKVVQIRGEMDRRKTDFTSYLLEKRWPLLMSSFE